MPLMLGKLSLTLYATAITGGGPATADEGGCSSRPCSTAPAASSATGQASAQIVSPVTISWGADTAILRQNIYHTTHRGADGTIVVVLE